MYTKLSNCIICQYSAATSCAVNVTRRAASLYAYALHGFSRSINSLCLLNSFLTTPGVSVSSTACLTPWCCSPSHVFTELSCLSSDQYPYNQHSAVAEHQCPSWSQVVSTQEQNKILNPNLEMLKPVILVTPSEWPKQMSSPTRKNPWVKTVVIHLN